jgi:hypothetical protein
MLKKTNILALVGTGRNPKFSPDKLIIWDDHRNKIFSELRFYSDVLRVKLKMDKIIVATKDNQLYVINLSNLEIINTFQTYKNQKGLFAVSSDDNIFVIAFPYRHEGYVKVKNYDSPLNVPTINAHDNNVSFITINHEGTLLSTSSEKGTLIRIFSVSNGELIQELRRGAKVADIYYITFDFNNKFIACSSSSGTIHIFSIYTSIKYLKEKGLISDKAGNGRSANNEIDININRPTEEPKNQKGFFGSIISVLKIGISYYESEWSFAQFRVPEPGKEMKVNFGQNNTIIVLTKNGKLFQASFEPGLGGECEKISNKDLIKELKKDNSNLEKDNF